MHVLITGGAGFIGSHLVDHHLGQGDSVHVVDDLSTGKRENLAAHLDGADLRLDEADILVWPDLAAAVERADRIYHLAAVVGVFRVLENPIRVLATNIAGTERLLRAVRAGGGNPELLIASTSEVYGPSSRHQLFESADLLVRPAATGRWNYAVSKLADEALALSYASRLDLKISVARLFNVIGPRQSGRYGMVVPRFIQQAVAGKNLTIYGDGRQSRCFCDVRDVVRAFDSLVSCPAAWGEIVNVGSDRECRIKDLAAMVRRRVGSGSLVEYIAYEEAYGCEYDDIQHRRPSLEKLKKLVDFRHRYTLEDSLDELIAQEMERATEETASEGG